MREIVFKAFFARFSVLIFSFFFLRNLIMMVMLVMLMLTMMMNLILFPILLIRSGRSVPVEASTSWGS